MQFQFSALNGQVSIWLDMDRAEVTTFFAEAWPGGKRKTFRSYCWGAAVEYPYPF